MHKKTTTKVYMVTDTCVELKNSISLTSSSSSDSQEYSSHTKVTGFMKNAAPSVVTKYIARNKMEYPLFVEKNEKRGCLYEKSIFSAALAIKTGKMGGGRDGSAVVRSTNANKVKSVTMKSNNANSKSIQKPNRPTMDDTATYKTDTSSTTTSKKARRMKRNLIISSDNSIITDTSSLSANSSNTSVTHVQKNPIEMLTPLQRRVLKVKKFQREHKSIGKAAGVRLTQEDESVKFKKDVRDYEAWKAKRPSKITMVEAGETVEEVSEVQVPRIMPHTSVKQRAAALENAIKTVVPTAPHESPKSIKFNDVPRSFGKMVSPPPPPPYKPPMQVETQTPTPFDECKEKVEVVTIDNQTFIIDKSRNVKHTVRLDDGDANRRRMELVERARSLIRDRD
jgi:hypothetical protein